MNYNIIRNAISFQLIELLRVMINMHRDVEYYKGSHSQHNLNALADKQCHNSFAFGRLPITDGLLQYLQPTIEEAVGKKLLPTYSYGRIYWNGSELKMHTDRDSCEYSATICIESDNTNWPIYIGETPIYLAAGDMVCYKGKTPHWRPVFIGNQQIQVFLHYVDANGPYSYLKFDGRPMLGFKYD